MTQPLFSISVRHGLSFWLAVAMLGMLFLSRAKAQEQARGRAAADAKESKPADAAAPVSPPTSNRANVPKGTFELIEWVVFVVDPNRANANEQAAFKSTLPSFARGRRPALESSTASKDPSPVGVIRLIGGVLKDEESIDVLLQLPAGRFLTYWPTGKPRTNRQLWERIALKEGTHKPLPVETGHWFEMLRGGNQSSPLSSSRWSEKFLLYDAEIPHSNVVRIKASDSGEPGVYELANVGFAVLRDVEVYAPVEDAGWRVGHLDQLAGTKPPPAPKPAVAGDAGSEDATAVPAGPGADALRQIFSEVSREVKPIDVKVQAKAAPAPSETEPQTRPTTRPATQASTQPTTQSALPQDVPNDAWRDVKLDLGAKPQTAADAIAPWRKRLEDAGLTSADVEVILATLRSHALDPEQLTIVYRIDSAELDRLIPIEVVPAPAKTTRVGLAIVKNIDPAAGERIARLIEELASPEWEKREAAQTKLAELGAGARPKLTEALKHSDVEVVYRAERLLEALNTPQ